MCVCVCVCVVFLCQIITDIGAMHPRAMDSLLCNSLLADEHVKPCSGLETYSADTAAGIKCSTLVEPTIPELCTTTTDSSSLTSVSSDISCCSKSPGIISSLQLPVMTKDSSEHRDLPLLSLPPAQALSSTPFSPQTPCSRFDSCVLQLNAVTDCACVAGAVLCRWDNIVGPRIVYVWTTTVHQQSWLAAKNILSYIARGTLAGEVNRDPRDEVKFFASSDSDVALATVVFSSRVAAASAEVTVYSMSVIVPYGELTSFLKIKSICLEWLSRVVLQLRVLLSQVQ